MCRFLDRGGQFNFAYTVREAMELCPANAQSGTRPLTIAGIAAVLLFICVLSPDRLRSQVTGYAISTIAGGRDPNGDGGPATNALISYPTALALDSTGNVYISSSYSIRKIATNGIYFDGGGPGLGWQWFARRWRPRYFGLSGDSWTDSFWTPPVVSILLTQATIASARSRTV